jgi:4,5-dihydroxyphthalate decarboxylase
MLLAGELDAFMCPWPPKAFYGVDAQIVRLIPDYRKAEQAYVRRVGYYPAHHILAIRRQVFEQHPWLVRSLYEACEQAKFQSQENRRFLADSTPWVLADIEETIEILGPDWQPYGVEPNRRMIQSLCDEEFAQRLIAQPLDSAAVFAEFEQAMGELS